MDFSLEQWQLENPDYARQAGKLPGDVLLVNSMTQDGAIGGGFHYRDGQIIAALEPGQPGLLIVELAGSQKRDL